MQELAAITIPLEAKTPIRAAQRSYFAAVKGTRGGGGCWSSFWGFLEEALKPLFGRQLVIEQCFGQQAPDPGLIKGAKLSQEADA